MGAFDTRGQPQDAGNYKQRVTASILPAPAPHGPPSTRSRPSQNSRRPAGSQRGGPHTGPNLPGPAGPYGTSYRRPRQMAVSQSAPKMTPSAYIAGTTTPVAITAACMTAPPI